MATPIDRSKEAGEKNRRAIKAAHMGGAKTATAIHQITGIKVQTIHTHLTALARAGEIDRRPPPGPPPRSKSRSRRKAGVGLVGLDLRERIRQYVVDQGITDIRTLSKLTNRYVKTVRLHVRELCKAGAIPANFRDYTPRPDREPFPAPKAAPPPQQTEPRPRPQRGLLASSYGQMLDITPSPRVAGTVGGVIGRRSR